MVNIIEESVRPSLGQKFARAFGSAASSASEEIPSMLMGSRMRSEENEALKRMGINLSGIHDPSMRKMISEQSLKGETAAHQKESALQGTLGAIDALEELISAPGIGLVGTLNPSDAARQNRAEFETTTSALLPAFKSIFPRGFTEKEFLKILKYIPKYHDTEATQRGKLKALRNLAYKYSSGEAGDLSEEDELERGEKVKFDISNPEHKAKRDQLMKSFGGDREKVRKYLSREFEE